MPRTRAQAGRVEEQQLADSLEQVPMGIKRAAQMMPVMSRNLSCRHFTNSILEGTTTESAHAPVAHCISTGVGFETDQDSRLSFPATKGLMCLSFSAFLSTVLTVGRASPSSRRKHKAFPSIFGGCRSPPSQCDCQRCFSPLYTTTLHWELILFPVSASETNIRSLFPPSPLLGAGSCCSTPFLRLRYLPQ